MEEENNNWIDLMIEREALPKSVRKEKTYEFCQKHDIQISTYHYQKSKTENWKKILKVGLMSAKRNFPEVLKVIVEKAKKGEPKFVDMYLNYVLQLAKNLDITTDGNEIQPVLVKFLKDGETNNNKDTTRVQEVV